VHISLDAVLFIIRQEESGLFDEELLLKKQGTGNRE